MFPGEKGVADLTGIKNGRVIWVEIKTSEQDALSPRQEAFKENIRINGGEYHRIWSVDQLEQMEIRRMI